MPKRLAAIVIGVVFMLPAAAWAQQPESADREEVSAYLAADDGWKQQRFRVGLFGGELVGGTSLGSTENAFFRSTFNTGDDSLWGGRFGWTFAPRFDVEFEIGRSTPGLEASLTDNSGRDRTDVEFSDLSVTYVMGVVSYSLIERSRWFVPYLSLGLGTVRASSDDESSIGATELGIIFGAGARARLLDSLGVRVDVRGLRSGFGSKQDEDELPKVFTGDYTASHLLWSLGLDFSF